MPIVVQSVGSLVFGSGTSIATAAPAGVAIGDLLVLCVSTQHDTAGTAPTGWTLAANASPSSGAIQSCAFWRIADGTADDTPTVSLALSDGYGAVIVRVTGNDPTTPFDVAATYSQASGSSIFVPAVTTTTASSLLIALASLPTNLYSGSPGGWTTEHSSSVFTAIRIWSETVSGPATFGPDAVGLFASSSAAVVTLAFSPTMVGGGSGVAVHFSEPDSAGTAVGGGGATAVDTASPAASTATSGTADGTATSPSTTATAGSSSPSFGTATGAANALGAYWGLTGRERTISQSADCLLKGTFIYNVYDYGDLPGGAAWWCDMASIGPAPIAATLHNTGFFDPDTGDLWFQLGILFTGLFAGGVTSQFVEYSRFTRPDPPPVDPMDPPPDTDWGNPSNWSHADCDFHFSVQMSATLQELLRYGATAEASLARDRFGLAGDLGSCLKPGTTAVGKISANGTDLFFFGYPITFADHEYHAADLELSLYHRTFNGSVSSDATYHGPDASFVGTGGVAAWKTSGPIFTRGAIARAQIRYTAGPGLNDPPSQSISCPVGSGDQGIVSCDAAARWESISGSGGSGWSSKQTYNLHLDARRFTDHEAGPFNTVWLNFGSNSLNPDPATMGVSLTAVTMPTTVTRSVGGGGTSGNWGKDYNNEDTSVSTSVTYSRSSTAGTADFPNSVYKVGAFFNWDRIGGIFHGYPFRCHLNRENTPATLIHDPERVFYGNGGIGWVTTLDFNEKEKWYTGSGTGTVVGSGAGSYLHVVPSTSGCQVSIARTLGYLSSYRTIAVRMRSVGAANKSIRAVFVSENGINGYADLITTGADGEWVEREVDTYGINYQNAVNFSPFLPIQTISFALQATGFSLDIEWIKGVQKKGAVFTNYNPANPNGVGVPSPVCRGTTDGMPGLAPFSDANKQNFAYGDIQDVNTIHANNPFCGWHADITEPFHSTITPESAGARYFPISHFADGAARFDSLVFAGGPDFANAMCLERSVAGGLGLVCQPTWLQGSSPVHPPGSGDYENLGAWSDTTDVHFTALVGGRVIGATPNSNGTIKVTNRPADTDAGSGSTDSYDGYYTGSPFMTMVPGDADTQFRVRSEEELVRWQGTSLFEGGTTTPPADWTPSQLAAPYERFLRWYLKSSQGPIAIDSPRQWLHVGQNKRIRTYHLGIWTLVFTSTDYDIDSWVDMTTDERGGALYALGKKVISGAMNHRVFRSFDGGGTGGAVLTVVADSAALERDSERSVLLLLTRAGSGHLQRRESLDAGATWSGAANVADQAGAFIDKDPVSLAQDARLGGAFVASLKTGGTVTIWISHDLGKTWKQVLS